MTYTHINHGLIKLVMKRLYYHKVFPVAKIAAYLKSYFEHRLINVIRFFRARTISFRVLPTYIRKKQKQSVGTAKKKSCLPGRTTSLIKKKFS